MPKHGSAPFNAGAAAIERGFTKGACRSTVRSLQLLPRAGGGEDQRAKLNWNAETGAQAVRPAP